MRDETKDLIVTAFFIYLAMATGYLMGKGII